MAETTDRTLQLLSLLQRRRYWTGPELAKRLEVSERTLRRDIERIRRLGYTVDAERGVAGGYRLVGAGGDTVLLLDDDETTALAVALHTAAGDHTELAEASLGALTKVLAMLNPDRRRRADAVRATTSVTRSPATVSPPLAVLDVLASACRDSVRVSFDYVAADGAASLRYVEAHHLVTVGSRWYLIAHDDDRNDWRTFRLDRITAPSSTRNSYPPRPAPAEDLREYVRDRLRGLRNDYRVVVDAAVSGEIVRHRYGRWVEVADLDDHRCRLTMDADSFEWPTHIVANLNAEIVVIEPPAFEHHLRAVADRLHRSRRTRGTES